MDAEHPKYKGRVVLRGLNKKRYEVFKIFFLHEHEANEGTLNGRSVDRRAYHQATEFDRGAEEVIRISRCSIPQWRILPHFGNICWMDRIICMILDVSIRIQTLQHGMEIAIRKSMGKKFEQPTKYYSFRFITCRLSWNIGNISRNEEGSSWITF